MNRRGFLGLSAALTGAAILGRSSRVLAAARPVTEREFCLVLDPGHGGENEGCLAHDGQVREKAVTLALAEQLAVRVVALIPSARVLLTRDTDETLHLASRVGFANACNADLFVSLHCNASPLANQTGFETYLLDLAASNREAALTAQRENDEGFARPTGEDDEVAAMVRELGMTQSRRNAAWFADAIHREYADRFPDRPDRGVLQGPFDVLMGARMPAVLHEVGFLDHAEEGPTLRSSAGQKQIVEGLAQAVLGYFNEVVRRS
ncbi:N-acetylmuramoyl-L-alanine amidase family protein [Nannocystaceae bacterium ST9]